MRYLILILILALVLASICGCGGTGGGSMVDAPLPPRGLTLQLTSEAVNPATVFYSAELTLRLPAGVAVNADPGTGEVPSDLVAAADPTALVGARYTAASTTAPASVKVIVANPMGLVVGPLAALTCSTTTGTVPGSGSFTVQDFVFKDASGIALDGIAPKVAVQAL